MEPIKLKQQLNESDVMRILVAVNKVKKISQDQMRDVFAASPNYLPPVVARVNLFLQKMAYVIKMHKLQTGCESPRFVASHPEDYQAMQSYFFKEGAKDKSWDDIVELNCLYDAIGRFCISTDKFFKSITGTPGETNEEIIQNLLATIDQEMADYLEDLVATNRYALRFFRKLLEKNATYLPEGIDADEVLRYIKIFIYDDELNR